MKTSVEDLNIEDLKKKYNGLWTLKIPLNDERTSFATCYLRKMDRPAFAIISKMIKDDALKGVEVLINTLWVAGDDPKLITQDFDALRSAGDCCAEILQARTGELKKN